MVKVVLLNVVLFSLSAFALDKQFAVGDCRLAIATALHKYHNFTHEMMVKRVDEIYGKYKTNQALAISASWKAERFSDPQNQTANFKYLVLALDEKPENHELILNPDKMNDHIAYTATIIAPTKTLTPAPSGFILESHIENILATSFADGGSPVQNEKDLNKRIQIFPIRSSEALLEKTPVGRFNKIDVAGTSSVGLPLKAVGIFIKVNALNAPLISPERLSELLSLSHEKQLPIIYIK